MNVRRLVVRQEPRQGRILALALAMIAATAGCTVYTPDLISADDPALMVDAQGVPEAAEPAPPEAGVLFDAAIAESSTQSEAGPPVEALPDAGPPPASDASSADSGPRLCSSSTGASVRLTIQNSSTTRTIVALWIDSTCVERSEGVAAPSTSFRSSTFTGHIWRVRDKATQAILRDVPPLTGDTTIVVP